MENHKKTLLAEGLLFVLAMIWGGTFVAGKVTLEGMDPYWIMVIRFFVGSTLLAMIFPKDFRALDKKTIKAGIEVGLLLGVGTAFQMIGLQYTTPAQQSFIIVTYVVTVPLLYWLVYKRYPGNIMLLASLLAFVGVGFLSLKDGFTINFGDILTFIYALLFAIQMLRVDYHAGAVSSPIGFTIVQLYTSGFVALGLAFVKGGSVFTQAPTLPVILGLLYLTLLNTSVAYGIQNFSQQYARPSKTALIISTESLFGALAAYFIVGESFTLQKVIGCSLVFLGIMVAQFGPKLLKPNRNNKVA